MLLGEEMNKCDDCRCKILYDAEMLIGHFNIVARRMIKLMGANVTGDELVDLAIAIDRLESLWQTRYYLRPIGVESWSQVCQDVYQAARIEAGEEPTDEPFQGKCLQGVVIPGTSHLSVPWA